MEGEGYGLFSFDQRTLGVDSWIPPGFICSSSCCVNAKSTANSMSLQMFFSTYSGDESVFMQAIEAELQGY